jgi:hypothetical protein
MALASKDPYAWELRKVALSLLWRVASSAKDGPDAKSVQAVIACLRDSTHLIKLEAVHGLGSMSRPKNYMVAQEMQKALHNAASTTVITPQGRLIRIWALTGLVNQYQADSPLDEKERRLALKRVGDYLENKDLDARIQAAEALGSLGPKAKTQLPRVHAFLNAELNRLKLLKELGGEKAKIGKELGGVNAAVTALVQIDKGQRTINTFLALVDNPEPNIGYSGCMGLLLHQAHSQAVIDALLKKKNAAGTDDKLKPVLDQTVKALEAQRKAPPPRPAAAAARRP